MKLVLLVLFGAGLIMIPVGLGMMFGAGFAVLVAGILAVLTGAGATYDRKED